MASSPGRPGPRLPPGTRQSGLALLAGALLLAAFPPVGWWWAAPLGVAALVSSLRGVGSRRAWLLVAVAHLVLFLPLLEWVRFLGAGPWIALSILQATVAGLLGPLVVLVDRVGRDRHVIRLVGLVGAILLVEALRARAPFGGLTWGRLGFGQSDGPLLPLAAIGGAPLVGAAVALIGLCLLQVATCLRSPRQGLVPAALLAATVGGALVVPLPVQGPGVQVATVQGNVPRSGVSAFAEDLVVLDNHVRETERLAAEVQAGDRLRPDLVIWPENASDIDPFRDAQAGQLIDGAVRELGVPVLVGAVLQGPGPDHVSNAGIVWSPQTGPGERYVKRHPVPFGEYIPFRAELSGLVKRLDQIPKDFYAADRPGLLDVGPARVGDVICFEIAYDGLVRDVVDGGAKVLVVQTNNATYNNTGQPAQQMAMSRLRAVEHGRAVLVAATSGISAIVRPDGTVQARSAELTPATLEGDVPLRTGRTPASRIGPYVEWLITGVGLLAALTGAVTAGARRRP